MSTAKIIAEPTDNRLEEAKKPDINPERGGMISVVFTSEKLTLRALEKAREMTKQSGASIAVIAVQAVPFILPIDRTSRPIEFVIRRFEKTISIFPEKIRVLVYICRDRFDAYKRALKPHVPTFIGIRKKWWPTRDQRLARKLHRAGYNVIIVEVE
jgi:hypothetical protein